MYIEGIRRDIKSIESLGTLEPFIRKHSIGIVIQCNLSYKCQEPYRELFDLGVTNETIDYAGKYAMFLLSCKIYNQDKEHIIAIATQFLNYKRLNYI